MFIHDGRVNGARAGRPRSLGVAHVREKMARRRRDGGGGRAKTTARTREVPAAGARRASSEHAARVGTEARRVPARHRDSAAATFSELIHAPLRALREAAAAPGDRFGDATISSAPRATRSDPVTSPPGRGGPRRQLTCVRGINHRVRLKIHSCSS